VERREAANLTRDAETAERKAGVADQVKRGFAGSFKAAAHLATIGSLQRSCPAIRLENSSFLEKKQIV